MRGKEIIGRSLSISFGITPAYAGKSVETARRDRNARDHPRLCGEKLTKFTK